MRMNQIAVLFMKTEFYYMLYDALTRRFISFAKVLTPRSMHLQNTLVTIDGNHFFKLDRSSYSIKSIQINMNQKMRNYQFFL